MGKQILGHIPLDPLVKSGSPTTITNSTALQRVVNHGTFEGIFLSNQQLLELSSKLQSENADGTFFIIGKEEGTESVEIIPFQLSANIKPQFYFKDTIRGKINIDLGRPFTSDIDSHEYGKLIIDSNGLRSDSVGALILPVVKKGTSQKTPPPSH
jgi:hypothetical protein